jgi:hypothetical protein
MKRGEMKMVQYSGPVAKVSMYPELVDGGTVFPYEGELPESGPFYVRPNGNGVDVFPDYREGTVLVAGKDGLRAYLNDLRRPKSAEGLLGL